MVSWLQTKCWIEPTKNCWSRWSFSIISIHVLLKSTMFDDIWWFITSPKTSNRQPYPAPARRHIRRAAAPRLPGSWRGWQTGARPKWRNLASARSQGSLGSLGCRRWSRRWTSQHFPGEIPMDFWFKKILVMVKICKSHMFSWSFLSRKWRITSHFCLVKSCKIRMSHNKSTFSMVYTPVFMAKSR